MIIVFLGPDGAGKSTVLAGVEAGLKAEGEDFESYYFAPGYLKRYRPKAIRTVTTNPHEGRQYGPIRTLAKICLMLFEFRMGIRQVRKSGQLVLFDRFIHDLLVDPVRYRMGRVRWWMRLLLKLAPKPDLVVIIVAPPEVIRSRKQEVPVEETERQVAAYRELSDSFRRAIVIENSGRPEDSIESALAEIRT